MRVMRTPRRAEIEITSLCNLQCRYCSHFGTSGDVHADLPLEDWSKFFQELNRLCVTKVTLSGGEPFLRPDLGKVIEAIINNRMRFAILSNGTLISDELALFLANTRRCDSVQVSIDGSIPATHDSFRGKGTFYKALEGVSHLQRHGVTVTVRVTIHRKNVDDLEDIAELLLEDIGLSSFSTNSASHLGLCRSNRELVQLSSEDRIQAMEVLLMLGRKYPGRISASAGPLAEARMWLEMERARAEGISVPAEKGRLTACGGVFEKLAVRADGVMVPCNQLSHMELGRINHDSVDDIWQSHPLLERLRGRINIPLGSFDFCQECEYINYCTGNCPALAYTLYGEENHPSPDACLRRFVKEGGRLPSEEFLMS